MLRDLQECKAEVFRRSQVILARRKKRRIQALCACVPVCLVLGALILYPRGAKGAEEMCAGNMSMAPERAEDFAAGGKSDMAQDVPQSASMVEVWQGDTLCAIYTGDRGEELAELLAQCAQMNTQDPQTNDLENRGEETAAYTLTVFLSDGTKTEYTIRDRWLQAEGQDPVYLPEEPYTALLGRISEEE